MRVKQLVKVFEEAIESNDVKKVKTLLQENPRLSNAGGKTKTTFPFLWQAAVRGRHKIVELLIKSGANVQELRMDYDHTFAGSPRITILHWMGIKAFPCTDDHIKVGEILVRHGADVNAYNPVEKVNIEPLRYAVVSGNTKWTEFLLRSGVKLEKRVSDAAANWVLFIFRQESRLDILLLLLKYGLDTKFRDFDGNNLLLMLSKQKNANEENAVKIAEFLLDAGVPIDEVDQYDLTPLHNSVCNLNINLASFLLKRGANVNTIDGNQDTPLFIAVLKCNKILVNLLLSYGVNIDAKNYCEQTALHSAMCRNDEEILGLLIEKGANIFALNEWGQTPFFKRLVRNPSDVNDENINRMIREFAKLNFENIPIAPVDFDQIQANANLRAYFEKCSTELNQVFGSKFYGNYSYYSILKMSKNIKKLANLSKNEEFIAMFNANLDNLICYGKDLRRLLNLAMEVRDMSDAVESRLKCIFRDHLPVVVISMLADELSLEDLPVQ